ncbi:hypothetical protein, partial [Pseudomonas sp. AB12(2023)]|uniref:hypothetical protein n=1 Tax=Pseudomonas sp. AB12(2023) TaxID=3048597 RepID=UPI002B228373
VQPRGSARERQVFGLGVPADGAEARAGGVGVVVAVLAAALDEVLGRRDVRVAAGVGVTRVIRLEQEFIIGHGGAFLVPSTVSWCTTPPACV